MTLRGGPGEANRPDADSWNKDHEANTNLLQSHRSIRQILEFGVDLEDGKANRTATKVKGVNSLSAIFKALVIMWIISIILWLIVRLCNT